MSQRFTVAAIQMVSGTDPAVNLSRAAALVAEAAAAGATLVVLPEYFCLMGARDTDKVALREVFGEGPMQEALARMARDHGVWLSAGTIPLECPDPARVFNTSLLYNPAGEVVSRYDKIHLFGFSGMGERYCESDTILAGTTPVKVETPFASLAFGICYDLRFPEMFRALAPFDVLILPAAFTAVTGEAHWETLIRARAIENQCYVVASAQGGEHQNGRKTHGQTMVVDPWGRTVAELKKDEGVITASIDLNVVQSVRARLPALAHRVL